MPVDIFIASSSLDRPTWEPVAHILTQKGCKVLVYEADKVASGSLSFSIRAQNNGGGQLQVYYKGSLIKWQEIGAAWLRRPNMFGPWKPGNLNQQTLDGERQALQSALWAQIPEKKWLNAPSRIAAAEPKLLQLQLASSLGFLIPETTVANDIQTIATHLPRNTIFKAARLGLLPDKKQFKYVYTTPVDISTLPRKLNPYPGIWQPNIPKKREWRITMVGSQCFEAAIYTTGEARADWRRPEFSQYVTLKHESFPDNLKKKCIQYLKRMGLRYGAFDFIEDEEGRIFFLECNPNGQYGWIEAELGLPISKAIAQELMAIAT